MKYYVFRWVEWNLDHATKHGVRVEECEQVVRENGHQKIGDGKLRVVGRGSGGRWLQVIFTFVDVDDNGNDDEIFVIHARPLTDAEKRRERRRS
ncbi:MAG: hypothetical protein FWD53_08415 [Phycisphaerales bacterium]|nr:hypothetical protein [Phycisphaerales bacterium]